MLNALKAVDGHLKKNANRFAQLFLQQKTSIASFLPLCGCLIAVLSFQENRLLQPPLRPIAVEFA